MKDLFYDSLPTHRGLISSLFLRADLFAYVPADWEVVITDIRRSSQAVELGQHKSVNVTATGSIVCVLNIAHKHHVTIPFFFGGDGATFLIPRFLRQEVFETLAVYRSQMSETFGLELRVGMVGVEAIYAAGHKLQIAKFQISPQLVIPLVTGNGLSYAEYLVKSADSLSPLISLKSLQVDLSGLQCTWDHITPPEDNNEILTILVAAADENDQGAIFSVILNRLDRIYGSQDKRQPISESKLKLSATLRDVGMAMMLKLGRNKWYEMAMKWFFMVYGYLYFRTRNGSNYLKTLVEMSDTLVVDGRINTVISGNQAQRESLLGFLSNLEDKGKVLYGFYVSETSVMSCYVPADLAGSIHFVDGAGGGYTQAARMLKKKLQGRQVISP